MKKNINANKFYLIIVVLVAVVGSSAWAANLNKWTTAKSLEVIPGVDSVMMKVEQMNEDGMELVYSMPELSIITEKTSAAGAYTGMGGGTSLELGNCPRKHVPGKPVLPVVPVRLVLPFGHDVANVNIIPGEEMFLPGSYVIEYGRDVHPLTPGIKCAETPRDEALYGSDDPYPGALYEVVGTQKKRGVSILFVNINPVVYKPGSGTVSYYRTIRVQVNTEPAGPGDGHVKYRSDSLGTFAMTADNPDMIETYADNGAGETGATTMAVDPSKSYDYVLVTSEVIKDAATDPSVNDLIVHRKSQGLSATVVSIESILLDYPGVDDAEKLRNFIIDAYNNWGTDYIVLGGDTNIIPMRKLWCDSLQKQGNGDPIVDQIPSDLYYQCLDGTYNSDGDDRWGELTDGPGGSDVDMMAEVYIGRISAENADEMSNFIYKTLVYENHPGWDSYLGSALMAGEMLGIQFGPGEFAFAKPMMEEIRNGSEAAGYSTDGFESRPFGSTETLYDWDYYWAHDNYWPKSVLIDKINANNFSVINHLGHANSDYVMKLKNADADALTNSKLFFAYSQGCIPGNFEANCIGEHLTTSTRFGAFAVVFNSRYGWGAFNNSYETLDGPSQRFNRQFWDALFNEDMAMLGAMNADSHEDNLWDINGLSIRWCYYESNLLGDPCTLMRVMDPPDTGNRVIALCADNGNYVTVDTDSNKLFATGSVLGDLETFRLVPLKNGRVALRAGNGKFVSCRMYWDGRLVANQDGIHLWENFELIETAGGFALRAYNNGKYVRPDTSEGLQLKAVSDTIGPDETFTVIDLKIAIMADNGKYARINPNNNRLFADSDNIGDLETFRLKVLENDQWAIQAGNGKYVSCRMYYGGRLMANQEGIHAWEKFELLELGGGQFAIQACNNDKYVRPDAGENNQLKADSDAIGTDETFDFIGAW